MIRNVFDEEVQRILDERFRGEEEIPSQVVLYDHTPAKFGTRARPVVVEEEEDDDLCIVGEKKAPEVVITKTVEKKVPKDTAKQSQAIVMPKLVIKVPELSDEDDLDDFGKDSTKTIFPRAVRKRARSPSQEGEERPFVEVLRVEVMA